MYRYKKATIYSITFIYIVLTIIELIKYLIGDNTLFGLYYLIVCLIVIFLLVPCAYNYNRYYSGARISKLIISILLILFDSFLFERIIFNSMGYMDNSKEYVKSIFIIKEILKPIVCLLYGIFVAFEFKLDEIIKKSISGKNA